MRLIYMAAGLIASSQAITIDGLISQLGSIVCDWDCESSTLTTQASQICNALQQSQCQTSDGPIARSNLREDWWAQYALNAIDGYGCWCHFDTAINNAGGLVQNGMDQICKDLIKGYWCAEWDGDQSGDACDPTTVAYTSVHDEAKVMIDAGTHTGPEAYKSACETVNTGSDCAARACAIEGNFLYQLIDYYFGGSTFDASLKHSLGSFDSSASCPRSTLKTAKDSYTCCGTYPERYRYKVMGSKPKTCCGSHFLLDSGNQQCCDNISSYDPSVKCCMTDGDGSLGNVGSC